MGNHKFRLSNMIPNAWFYKLKDMNKPRNQHKKDTSSLSLSLSLSSSSSSLAATNDLSKITSQPHMSDQRKSYYFTRDLTNSPTKTEPPRISSRRRRRRRSTKKNQTPPRLVSTSISASCSCRASLESVRAGSPSLDQTTSSSSSDHDSVVPQYGSDRTDASVGTMPVSTNPCKCGMQNDIVFNVIDDDNLDRLPPIITKKKQVSTDMCHLSSQATNQRDPTKIHRTSAEFSETNAYGSLSVKVVKEDFLSPTKRSVSTASPARRLSTQGVKLRTNSPRIANRRVQGGKISSPLPKRRSVSESFAVMKSSKDPRRDFRESMVQMIVENNLKASKDLEELLACYLSLNSDEYHDLIINVFKQIWFDYVHVRLN